jgi:SAM-dependent methyltransferase
MEIKRFNKLARKFIKNIPVFSTFLVLIKDQLRLIFFRGSAEYWESLYRKGGTSGEGSYGRLAVFKAEIINNFVSNNRIKTIIELGCGDGHQLSLAGYNSYIGLDVSQKAIMLCKKLFQDDHTKSFFLYDPDCFVDNHNIFSCELSISLDVIYHLTEDDIYERYMHDLFNTAQKYVLIYSSDTDVQTNKEPHIRHRNLTKFVYANFPEWSLSEIIKNKYPYDSNNHLNTSFCNFLVFKKR